MSSTAVDDDFERLYRRHVRDVYRFALALLRNPAEAEDVTQTTFLNAYRAMEAGEEPHRAQNWLLTIAHNTARSRVRLAMRRPREVPLDDVVEHLAMPEHERTNVRELLRALGRLPFNQRAAITMRELEGRSYPEIAETLGVTVPAVEALLTRARKTLRLHASAIRGLAVVGLPRSLRRLLENGETPAGSAIGAGAAAKAAAVLVGGLVAGGIGFTSSDAGTPQGTPPPRPALVRDVALAAAPIVRPRFAAPPVAHVGNRIVRTAPVTAKPNRHHVGTAPPAQETPRVGEAAPVPAASSAPSPSSAAAPAAGRPARHPVETGTDAVASGAAAVTSTVASAVSAAVPAIPSAPPVQVPPVQLPPAQLPPPPAVPTVPAVPTLPPLP